MKLLTSLRTRIRGAYRALRSLPAYDDFWYRPASMLGSQGLAGRDVSQESALAMSAVYRCMRILSDSVASLPCYLYQKYEDGSRRRATERVVHGLLNHKPNDEMSAYTWKNAVMANLLGYGNSYNYVGRDSRQVRRELVPLNPVLVQVERNKQSGEIEYVFSPQGRAPMVFHPSEILHLKSFSYSGLVGRSVISQAREAIGTGLAQEEFGARFYGDGTHPGLVATHPGSPKPETLKNLKEALLTQVGGLGKSHRLLMLQDNMKLENITINPVDAEYIASRQFTVQEVSRFFGVPLHLLSDVDASKGRTNMQVESIDFLKFSVGPWLSLIQSELNRFFLTPDERQYYYFEFLVDSILKTDIKTRYQAYEIARSNGWMSADEIRQRENMAPLPNGQGAIIITKPGTLSLTAISGGGGQGAVGE